MDLIVIAHMMVPHLHPDVCELGHWLLLWMLRVNASVLFFTTEILHTIASVLKTT